MNSYSRHYSLYDPLLSLPQNNMAGDVVHPLPALLLLQNMVRPLQGRTQEFQIFPSLFMRIRFGLESTYLIGSWFIGISNWTKDFRQEIPQKHTKSVFLSLVCGLVYAPKNLLQSDFIAAKGPLVSLHIYAQSPISNAPDYSIGSAPDHPIGSAPDYSIGVTLWLA